ncbi:MAG: exodeoxyribonuclease VII small subunit [Salinivirgaceae bacterium]|jgi:exodeoxyribonuclease VII small subunit|nr:exodeoxyribonuclease VII small subunit [Bacteroidales bacterium]
MAKKSLSYTEKIQEIESIIEFIESNPPDIDVVRNKISRAISLLTECKSELQETEEDIQKLFDKSE